MASTALIECKDDDALNSTLRSCANDPDFAIICSFLQKFSNHLGIDLPNFKHLQEWLTNTEEVSDLIRDLHIKLLRKTRKTVHEKSWEAALCKFCISYSFHDSWEIERFGYKNVGLKVKLRVLRELLECQFERNPKFRATVQALNGNAMRTEPIGRDRLGHSYWLTQDGDCNLRVYQEHLDEEIWQVVATNRDEFVNLIARLRGNEVVLPSADIGIVDEDTSSSNSCNAPMVKPPPPEEQDDSQEEEPKVPNLRIKLNVIGRKNSNENFGKGEEELAAEEDAKIKKVKPLLITQAKLASITPTNSNSTKKRALDDVDKSSPPRDDINTLKKPRPTLLDAKRVKKRSRYETQKSEEDNDGDDSDEEEQDSESDDDEEGEEEEEDEDEEEGEEEDIDSAAAEEDENEAKYIEEDDDDDDKEKVGEAIEDPPINIRGHGSGNDCDVGNPYNNDVQFFLNSYEAFDNEHQVGDAIEEAVIVITGLGTGAACFVGNNQTTTTNETETQKNEPKATFFFGEPGCLKLSPIKQSAKEEDNRSIFDSIEEAESKDCASDNKAANVEQDQCKEQSKTETMTKTNGENTKIVQEKMAEEEIIEDSVQSVAVKEINNKEITENVLKNDEAVEKNDSAETSVEVSNITENNKIDNINAETVNDDATLITDVDDNQSEKIENVNINVDNSETSVSESISISVDMQSKNETLPIESKSILTESENFEVKTETIEISNISINNENAIHESLELDHKENNIGNETSEGDHCSDFNENADIAEQCKLEKKIDVFESKCESTAKNEVLSKALDIKHESLKTDPETNVIEQNEDEPKSTNKSIEIFSNEDKTSNDNINVNNKQLEPQTELTKNPVSSEIIINCAEKSLETTTSPQSINNELTAATTSDKIKMPSKICNQSAIVTPALPNRKRRLGCIAAEAVATNTAANTRHSTSESEVDLHSEQNEDINEAEFDELDIGGKRIKMRPKLTNTELRRKVEAQKTLVEETTSSSGEEDSRSRRKIISPKRQLNVPVSICPKVDEKPVATLTQMPTIKGKSATVTSLAKQKPTLAEIIEKKLKKTPEKTRELNSEPQLESITTQPSIAPTNISEKTPIKTTPTFTLSKKSPITKPLKKNLLTQIRQEESDEETIPRKRTISETVAANSAAIVETPMKPAETVTAEKMSIKSVDRQTPERQRKRRSSEDAKNTESFKTSTENIADGSDGVCEKLKRSNEEIAELAKEKIEEENAVEQPKEIKPLADKESTPEPTTQTVSGRRSGRRGGTAVIYSELPQPKRTRAGAKATTEKKEPVKIEKPVEVKEKPQSLRSTISKSENVGENVKEAPKTPIIKSHVKVEAEESLEKQSAEVNSVVTPKTTKTATTKSNSASTISSPNTPASSSVRGVRKTRDVDTTNIIETIDNETPVRQSRRIALQKIKEEAERRKLEEIALRTMKQELKKKKKAEKEADPTVVAPSEESSSSSAAESEEVETKKKVKKKCPGKDGWSSGSEEQEDEEEEEEPPHYETDPGSPLFKSDHEFSPESELEDESQVVPMKRARTLRKENAEGDELEDATDESCSKCGKSDHPEWILLCDKCDKGYHCSCLSPVLFYIPEGDWYCPPCQQDQLISALERQLKDFDELVARKETEKYLAQVEAERVQRVEEERLEEEKKQNANKKSKSKKEKRRDSDSESSGHNSSDDNKTNKSNRGSDDHSDDESVGGRKVSKQTSAKRSKKSDKTKKSKRRRGDGRSQRRAATRGNRRRRRNVSDSGSNSKSVTSGSGSDSSTDSSQTSSSATDSDDEPIYKLRKRRQINVSYRLNEYDDLIDSALKKEMDGAAGAGNLGRGKDITTIIEADKEEQARLRNVDDVEDAEPIEEIDGSKEESTAKIEIQKSDKENAAADKHDNNDDDDDDDVPLKVKSRPRPTILKKKSRKLTTLDVSSEEDHGSDEDFKTSSFEDDEDTSISASSNTDSSLEIYRRRGKHGGGRKKQRKAARRAARERRKDRKFVVDGSDESEEEQRPKVKKKRKKDSDYTETETDDDDVSELSENVDSADLCDDSSSEESDGAWHPSKRKKQRKSNVAAVITARKSPKLKKPQVKKPKRVVEYSDDDISETEPEEDEEDDDDVAGGGKGSGKQPRSQPLKSSAPSTKGKGKGKGKEKTKATAAKKKKKPSTSEEQSGSDSADSTRRTRGRRYAYLEDFDDDSSDGGIKPGVQRPDTPPEERQKFIQKQEEIKRMLAEKNAEAAKLAATPRLTPIKSAVVASAPTTADKRTPTKASDSLSTVPLSVIRQAKVLDIDYLQRKGENIGELDHVDDVDSEFDDADLPDDLPEDMDEDTIARMVEEDDEFSAVSARELPAPDEVLRTPNKSSKAKEPEKTPPPVTVITQQAPTINASGLQEPQRKRLPMPTMHPPLLRHQFPPQHGMHPHHMFQRHSAPPMQLLQNALNTPLGQPLNRNFTPHHQPHPSHHLAHAAMQRISPSGIPPTHLMHTRLPHQQPPATQSLNATRDTQPTLEQPVSKPRGRRKKITPLRDPLQKQQAAAAATAAASIDKSNDQPSSVLKSTGASSLAIAQPPQLYKPPGAQGDETQPSVITRMPHLPSHAHTRLPPPPGSMYPNSELHARFYGPPPPASGGGRSQQQQHRLRPPHQMPHGMPPHGAMRQTYGPPPPLRGALPNHSQPPTSGGSSSTATAGSGSRLAYGHGDHHGAPPPLGSSYGGGQPPPARHASQHLNPYRPPIFGNPNYAPRIGPPTAANMRPGASPHRVDYATGPRAYPPYGYYPPPPPLTTPPAHTQPVSSGPPQTTAPTATTTSTPSSVIVSAPPASAPPSSSIPSSTPNSSSSPSPNQAPPPTNHSVSALTRIHKTSPSRSTTPAATTENKSANNESRKKLTTLEAYSNATKSPLLVSGGAGTESSRSPADLQADAAEDSSSAPGSSATAVAAVASGAQASEFSGLVSYFSSQHDDYNT